MAIASENELKFNMSDPKPIAKHQTIVISPPLGFMRLEQSCRASNRYLTLPAYYVKENSMYKVDDLAILLKRRNASKLGYGAHSINTLRIFPL